MKTIDSQKVLIFPSQPTAQPPVSIHPDLWADTVRPSDARDLRLNRIAELRSAIAAGTYSVSTAALAGKLMAHMRSNA